MELNHPHSIANAPDSKSLLQRWAGRFRDLVRNLREPSEEERELARRYRPPGNPREEKGKGIDIKKLELRALLELFDQEAKKFQGLKKNKEEEAAFSELEREVNDRIKEAATEKLKNRTGIRIREVAIVNRSILYISFEEHISITFLKPENREEFPFTYLVYKSLEQLEELKEGCWGGRWGKGDRDSIRKVIS